MFLWTDGAGSIPVDESSLLEVFINENHTVIVAAGVLRGKFPCHIRVQSHPGKKLRAIDLKDRP